MKYFDLINCAVKPISRPVLESVAALLSYSAEIIYLLDITPPFTPIVKAL
jgi:hypothetical protein